MLKLEQISNQKNLVIDNEFPKKQQNENYVGISYKRIKFEYGKYDKKKFDKQFPDDLAYGIRC